MWLDNAVVTILLVSSLLKANSILGEGWNNRTTASSSSPWLRKAAENHFRPRPPGCWRTPWICRQGDHRPTTRMRCCGNQCVDVFSDVNNCGWCGIRCPFSWQCCRGICTNTNISPFNCGRCGNRCPWRVQCVYGMCGYGEPVTPTPFPPPWPRPPFPFPPRQPKPWHPPHPPKGLLN